MDANEMKKKTTTLAQLKQLSYSVDMDGIESVCVCDKQLNEKIKKKKEK